MLRSNETSNGDDVSVKRRRRADASDASQCPWFGGTAMSMYNRAHASSAVGAEKVNRTSTTVAPAMAASARIVALVASLPIKFSTTRSRCVSAAAVAVAAVSAAATAASAAVSADWRAVDASSVASSASSRADSAAADFAST